MFKFIKHSERSNKQNEVKNRFGAVAVEFAVVAPVFGLFLIAMVEFGHVYMAKNVMRAAVRKAARLGVAGTVTSAQAEAEVRRILSSAFDDSTITVKIKNASTFDSADYDPNTFNLDELPDLELSSADPMQLFIIRVSVPYDNIALLPTFWVNDYTVSAQSVMRHE